MRYKLFFLYLFALALFSPEAFSQVSFGLRLGTHFANIAVSDTAFLDLGEPKLRAGASIGFAVELALNEKIALQAEPNFVQKGWRFSTLDNTISPPEKYFGKITFRYLNLPLLVKLRFSGPNSGFYAFAGPDFGYMTSGKYRVVYEYDGVQEIDEAAFDFSEDESFFNRFDIGAIFGAGYQYNIKHGRVFFDARYNYGFSNAINPEELGEEDGFLSNRGFGFALGYLYTF